MRTVNFDDLRKMSQISINDIDEKELVDINNVHIKADCSIQERVLDYIEQVKNPYCFLSHGVKVKISFAGKADLNDCIVQGIHFGAEDTDRIFREQRKAV